MKPHRSADDLLADDCRRRPTPDLLIGNETTSVVKSAGFPGDFACGVETDDSESVYENGDGRPLLVGSGAGYYCVRGLGGMSTLQPKRPSSVCSETRGYWAGRGTMKQQHQGLYPWQQQHQPSSVVVTAAHGYVTLPRRSATAAGGKLARQGLGPQQGWRVGIIKYDNLGKFLYFLRGWVL